MTTVDVDAAVGLLTVGVESTRSPMGCPERGVIADGHGRSDVTLVDAPCFDRIVRIVCVAQANLVLRRAVLV